MKESTKKGNFYSRDSLESVNIKHDLYNSKQDFIFRPNLYSIFGKRIFDFILSFVSLVILSPILILFYLITLISSKGPGLYFQTRVGRGEKEFYIIKFRSMYINSEPFGPQLTSENDQRITKWGRIMRKYYIDELPQLINILIGDMSFIGPRPERRYYINELEKRGNAFKPLLSLRPGLSSLGQVEVGYAPDVETMEERLIHEKKYLKMISIFTDFKIILKTLKKVFYGFGV
jgi:lipopolysaccharide/colanic/teichoic acid biosynthesis glycosyltransferase